MNALKSVARTQRVKTSILIRFASKLIYFSTMAIDHFASKLYKLIFHPGGAVCLLNVIHIFNWIFRIIMYLITLLIEDRFCYKRVPVNVIIKIIVLTLKCMTSTLRV